MLFHSPPTKMVIQVKTELSNIKSLLWYTLFQRGDTKEWVSGYSWDTADLNGLQHVVLGDVGDGHNEVAGLHHAARLQERERSAQVALHVTREVEAEGDQPPLQVQPLPHRLRVGEGEDGAVGTQPGQERRHVAASRVHEDGVHFQSVCCTHPSASPQTVSKLHKAYPTNTSSFSKPWIHVV